MPSAVRDAARDVANALGSDIVDALGPIGLAIPFVGSHVVLGHFLGPEIPEIQTPQIGALGRLQTVRQPIAHWQVIYGRRRVPGVVTFVEVTSATVTNTMPTPSGLLGRAIDQVAAASVVQDNAHLHLVITWAGHACEAIDEIHFDDELVWDSVNGIAAKYANVLDVVNDLGTTGQPFPSLVGRSAGLWTNEHKQAGRTKSYFRLFYSQDLFPSGIPNVTAVIKGVNDVYDPRTATRGWSDNPALCAAHYLESVEFGLAADLDDEVDLDELETAANDCDADVYLADGSTEARYSLNLVFLTSEEPGDILELIALSMAGRIAEIGAAWKIFAGVYQAPTVTLDEGDLAGPVEIQTMVPMEENANRVKGTFTDPDGAWQPTDYPALAPEAFLAEDNNVQRWKEIKVERVCLSGMMAQRIGKIALYRLRQGAVSFGAPFKLSALRVYAGTTFAFSFSKYGWSSKAFECLAWTLALEGNELVIRLAGAATASTVYDWSISEEQAVDSAPATNLPDPFTIGTPGAPVVAESLYSTRSSVGLKTQVTVSWSASSDSQAEAYEVRYKLASDPDSEAYYVVLPPTRNLWAVISDVEPANYDFAVRAISFLRVRSSWVTTRKEIRGLAEPPEDLAGLSIQAIGGVAYLKWTAPPDLDVREGGWIEFRHSPDFALVTWESSFSIGERVAGNETQTALPLKPGTYLARPVDSSGNYADAATLITTKQASAHTYVTVASVAEDPDFAGTHSGTVGTDSILKLAGTTLIDSVADFDAISPAIDSLGGVQTSGTYTFANDIDLGSVQNVRLTSEIAGFLSNVNDLIDSRTGNVDDWADWDGTAGASGDAWIEARETDDDPASSPSWSDWKRLDAAEFSARAFEFRARLQSDDAAYNVTVETLRVTAAQVS